MDLVSGSGIKSKAAQNRNVSAVFLQISTMEPKVGDYYEKHWYYNHSFSLSGITKAVDVTDATRGNFAGSWYLSGARNWLAY